MFLITNINDKTFWEKKDLKVTTSSKYSGYFTPVFHMC